VRLSLLLLLATACATPFIARKPEPGEPVLRVMTFNVNYGVPPDADTLAAIAEAKPDILLVQELNSAWRDALAKWPHHVLEPSDDDASGLGVASKLPLEEVTALPRTQEAFFGAQKIVVTTALGRVQLLNVHLRPPVSDSGSLVSGYFSTREGRKFEIANHAGALDDHLPSIVAGDFNEENGRAVAWLEERRWQSADQQLAPGEPTWHWPWVVELKGSLDHVFYAPSLEPFEVRVLKAGRSDHLPVLAVFGLQKR
jgi:endonuclease/exonuclease/phosphatase family metal-dependent hydrolase